MTLAELKTRFPDVRTLMSEPLTGCPQCGGTGVFTNRKRQERPCLCAHLSTTDDSLRLHAVSSFRKTINTLRQELSANASTEARYSVASGASLAEQSKGE